MAKQQTKTVTTVTLVFEKETKGAVRYQEIDANGQPVDYSTGHIVTLYVRKSAFAAAGGKAPAAIRVTIEAAS